MCSEGIEPSGDRVRIFTFFVNWLGMPVQCAPRQFKEITTKLEVIRS